MFDPAFDDRIENLQDQINSLQQQIIQLESKLAKCPLSQTLKAPDIVARK